MRRGGRHLPTADDVRDDSDTSRGAGALPAPRWPRSRVLAVLVVLAHVVGFFTSIHAVMSTRTPQGTIAWAVSLNTFPYIAVPAY